MSDTTLRVTLTTDEVRAIREAMKDWADDLQRPSLTSMEVGRRRAINLRVQEKLLGGDA